MAAEFLIRQEELQRVQATVQKICESVIAAAADCEQMIGLFQSDQTCAGAFSDSVKSYFSEIHRAALRSFSEIARMIQREVQSYVAGYAAIDGQAGFVLPESTMEAMKSAVTRQQQLLSECVADAHAALQNVSDLFGTSGLFLDAAEAETQQFCGHITALEQEIHIYETSRSQIWKDIQSAVQQQRQVVSQLDAGTGFQKASGEFSITAGLHAAEPLICFLKLGEAGFDYAGVVRMGRYGYEPADIVLLYESCTTDSDREFLLYLTEGDYERAFAQDPGNLSDSIGVLGADYACRLFSAEDRAELEAFNNAVLVQNDGIGWFSDPSPGSKTIRQAYLEDLFQGSMALLELNSVMILQGDADQQTRERNWDLLSMADLWNMEYQLEEDLCFQRDPRIPVQVFIQELHRDQHQLEYEYVYTAISHNPFSDRQEVIPIAVTSDILETSDDLLNGIYLAERSKLQESQDHLAQKLLGAGIWDAGVGIISVAVPELGVALGMLETVIEQDVSEYDDDLLSLAGKMHLTKENTGNILLGEAIDGWQAYLDKNTELSDKIGQLDSLYEGSLWGSGIRSSYTIPDAFSSGHKIHILSGIYNPDYLETIGEWNRQGIAALLPAADIAQIRQALEQYTESAGSAVDPLVYQMIHGFGEDSILDYPINEIAQAKKSVEDLIRDIYSKGDYVYHWNVEKAF